MKVTRLLLLSLMLVILVSACSNPSSKPADVSQEFWGEGIELSILVNKQAEGRIAEYLEGKDVSLSDVENYAIGTRVHEWSKQENLSAGEEEIARKVRALLTSSSDFIFIESYRFEYVEKEYKKNYEAIENTFGKSNLIEDDVTNNYLQEIVMEYKKGEKKKIDRQPKKVDSSQETETTINKKSGNDWLSLNDNEKYHAVSNALYNLDQQGYTILEGEYYFIDALDAFYSDSTTSSTSVSKALAQIGLLSGTISK